MQLAEDLLAQEVAQPTFWLGDETHYRRAVELFGKEHVHSLATLRYAADIVDLGEIELHHSGFFFGEEYSRAKDICLKMMDRLDDAGLFTRLDREAWLHKIALFALYKISSTKIDVLLMSEAPHNHVQYMVYEVIKFLKIPIFKFNVVLPVPALYLVNDSTGVRISPSYEYDTRLLKSFDFAAQSFLNRIVSSQSSGEKPVHMAIQEADSSGFKNFIARAVRNNVVAVKETLKLYLRPQGYRSTNPFNYNYFRLGSMVRRRRLSLVDAERVTALPKVSSRYAYFPLHYEPERTTTPDGGELHDQLKAIIAFRAWLPDDIDLVIKEHPSQFYPVRDGYKGRSRLFYPLIQSLKGVSFVSIHEDSTALIAGADLVFVISGTAAVEASILGVRSVCVADTWFAGAPNIFKWASLRSFKEILETPVCTASDVFDYIRNFISNETIPAFQNMSSNRRYKDLLTDLFYMQQRVALKQMVAENIFKQLRE